MKNLFYSTAICFAAIVLTLQFSSCEKAKTSSSVFNSNNNLLIELKKSTDEFVVNQNDIAIDSKAPKWLGILKADLAGALTGFLVGGQPTAILIGALSSINAAERVGLPGNSNGTQPKSYPLNLYEFMGEQHYSVISFIANNPGLIFDGNVCNYNKYLDFNYLMLSISDFDDQKEICLNSIDNGLLIGISDTEFSLLSHINQYDMAEIDKAFLIQYFLALDATTNTDDFVNYSVLVESQVISSDLSIDSKELLLSMMSTARLGVAYWN